MSLSLCPRWRNKMCCLFKHCTLYTQSNALQAIHRTQCTAPSFTERHALHALHRTQYTARSALYAMNCNLCTVCYELHTLHCTLCTVRNILHAMDLTICTAVCTTVHCTHYLSPSNLISARLHEKKMNNVAGLVQEHYIIHIVLPLNCSAVKFSELQINNSAA